MFLVLSSKNTYSSRYLSANYKFQHFFTKILTVFRFLQFSLNHLGSKRFFLEKVKNFNVLKHYIFYKFVFLYFRQKTQNIGELGANFNIFWRKCWQLFISTSLYSIKRFFWQKEYSLLRHLIFHKFGHLKRCLPRIINNSRQKYKKPNSKKIKCLNKLSSRTFVQKTLFLRMKLRLKYTTLCTIYTYVHMKMLGSCPLSSPFP